MLLFSDVLFRETILSLGHQGILGNIFLALFIYFFIVVI